MAPTEAIDKLCCKATLGWGGNRKTPTKKPEVFGFSWRRCLNLPFYLRVFFVSQNMLKFTFVFKAPKNDSETPVKKHLS